MFDFSMLTDPHGIWDFSCDMFHRVELIQFKYWQRDLLKFQMPSLSLIFQLSKGLFTWEKIQ